MNAPLFLHFFLFLFISHYCKKTVHEQAGPWQGVHGPPVHVLSLPNNFAYYNIDLVQAESLRRVWEREDDYTVFQYFFQSKRNDKMYLWDVIIQTISRAIFNSIFSCSYSRNYLILTSNSLPADVLWGSFVTHSFSPTVPLPHGPWRRNECVTNEAQRTSAGALDEQERFSHFHTQTPC